MVGIEAGEVGGVADEDAVLAGQTILEFGCGEQVATDKHEMGVGGQGAEVGYLVQGMVQALRLDQISCHVRYCLRAIGDEPPAGLDGQGVDRPGTDKGTDAVDICGSGDNVADAQAGHGVGLGEGMNLDDVATSDGLGRRHEGLEAEVLVGLVEDGDE